MTIRKKMLILALLPVTIGLVVAVIGGLQLLKLEKHFSSLSLAENLEEEIRDLNFTTDRFLVIHEPELVPRWEAKQKKLAALLEHLEGEPGEEAEVLDSIRDLNRQVFKLFTELAAIRDDDPFPEAAELRIRLADNVMIKSHEMLSLSERISKLNQKGMRDIRRYSLLVTVGGFAVVTLLGALIALRVQRTVTRSVHALKTCTDALAAGDLTCRIDLRGNDELAALGRAFNLMATELKRSYDQVRDKSLEYEKLNNRLEQTVRQRTSELAEVNRLLVGAQEHQAKQTQKATVKEQKIRDLWMRTRLLIRKTGLILGHGDEASMLEDAMELARELTLSRLSITGHYFTGRFFVSGIASRAPDAPSCPSGGEFRVEQGGVYLDILREGKTLRLTQEQLEGHPLWWGLPEGHAPLRGLLGVPVPDPDGKVVGLIMVTDKADGEEYTEEDEVILTQLAEVMGQALDRSPATG
ncbi:MAG TPA: GAF domain-containing protein [Verrucomicrobiae bacterium]|nr:GAF domain-containing protein [Verrucomicrobiae bacterium]